MGSDSRLGRVAGVVLDRAVPIGVAGCVVFVASLVGVWLGVPEAVLCVGAGVACVSLVMLGWSFSLSPFRGAGLPWVCWRLKGLVSKQPGQLLGDHHARSVSGRKPGPADRR
jgi:hypothetical protein